ncbi:MAG: RNA polymerase sigma factor [Phycisphaerales bacterium]|nr:RNA polymerase sigma factor [Phycisphaerales bacterium]
MSMAQTQLVARETEVPAADSERSLIERAKHDREAFGILYRQHHAMLCNHVFRRTGDVHVTEDLVSEVFLTVLRTLRRYRYRGVPLRYYLLRIATNAVNRWARRNRQHAIARLRSNDLIDPRTERASASSEIDSDEALVALLTLSPKHQAVLSLHYLEGLRVDEIATVVGCRDGTVKSRLARARDALREELRARSTTHD